MESMRPRKVILTATNFAFGPTGKLLTLASLVRRLNCEPVVLGEGNVTQLARRTLGDFSVHECNFLLDSTNSHLADILRSSLLLISVMDLPSVRLAQNLGLPVMYVDSLFWYWPKIPKCLWDVEAFVYQRSLPEKGNLEVYAKQISHLVAVGPIVDLSHRSAGHRRNVLLVHFGGMNAQHFITIGKNSDYPFTMLDLILRSKALSVFEDIVVVGNDAIVTTLRERFPHVRVRYEELGHDSFLRALSEARLLLTSPGLETTLEAFSYGVPTAFLPPQNNSQYIQMDHFVNCGVATEAIHLSDYFEHLTDLFGDSDDSIEPVLAQIGAVGRSEDVARSIVLRLDQLFTVTEWHDRQMAAQRRYLEALGTNGCEAVLHVIAALACRAL